MERKWVKKKKVPQFLSNLVAKPLADYEIVKIAKKHIKHFRGVYSRNDLPKRPLEKENIVINMDGKEGQGTHWVALSKYNKDIEYYDSFGNLYPPIEVIRYVNGLNIKYNRDRDQSWTSSVCGHLSLLFLYNRSIRYEESYSSIPGGYVRNDKRIFPTNHFRKKSGLSRGATIP